jgi:hypothetical protein
MNVVHIFRNFMRKTLLEPFKKTTLNIKYCEKQGFFCHTSTFCNFKFLYEENCTFSK